LRGGRGVVDSKVREISEKSINSDEAAGCTNVYSEKASGARGDHTELRKVIDRLQPGDVLVVTRLARSTRDLLNVLRHAGREKLRLRSPYIWGRPRNDVSATAAGCRLVRAME
jgi:DNA invertase Pin-like site-specific DNA recombinase